MTYVAAITAILARYPEDVITTVTHPATGLPKKKSWLPTIKEVSEACDDAVEFAVQNEARLKRIKEQLKAREEDDKGIRPTYDELKAKYGPNWGLDPVKPVSARNQIPVPSWDQIVSNYQADPSLLQALLKKDE